MLIWIAILLKHSKPQVTLVRGFYELMIPFVPAGWETKLCC